MAFEDVKDNNLESFSDVEPVHNEADYDRYASFKSRLDSIYSRANAELERTLTNADLKKWNDSKMGRKWAGIELDSLSEIGGKDVRKAIESDSFTGLFIGGEPASGKTTLSRVAVRELIALGKVKPSEVKIISESEILLYSKRGFAGEIDFKKLLSPKIKLYVIDDAGEKDYYSQDREIPYLESLYSKAYDEDKILIIVSNKTRSEFLKSFSESVKAKISETCFFIKTKRTVDSLVEPSEMDSKSLSGKRRGNARMSGGKLSEKALSLFDD